MLVEYKRDLDHNYMILSDEEKMYDYFQIKMLQENKIKGILKSDIREIDNQEKFYYEISSKQSISIVYEKMPMDYDALSNIWRGIVKAVESAREYLLDINHFIFHQDYIYMNLETKQIYLCFFPLYSSNPQKTLFELMEYILDKINHTDNKAVMLAYNLYKKIKEENVNICSILYDCLEGEENSEEKAEDFTAEIEKSKYIEPKQEKMIDKHNKQRETTYYFMSAILLLILIMILLYLQIYKPVIPKMGMKIYRATVVIIGTIGGVIAFISFLIANRIYKNSKQEIIKRMEYKIDQIRDIEKGVQKEIDRNIHKEETAILLQDGICIRKLISLQNKCRQEIIIDKNPFIIGKMEQAVNSIINERTISKIHAKISEEKGKYYLTDLNSTNGTYKNGVRLTANETVEIRSQDEIKLGNKIFYFD